MKLKKLEITGFKSFHEKSVISFPTGISAIVGPNGCGKSNIVDALRWVMGEQSVKTLRGKSMEDVIFAGAAGKAPLSMAEVTLVLNNDNGSAPEELKDFTEIMMTRRLYRSGESAYFLNKQPCRLKDIHNVFLGSGMGAKSYSIIQQGNIGAIIDAGPDERRYFLEEAAGTTRFKNRKAEALRKVQATRQNLLRVSDIISEIQRQMTGLKRQAKKAERYRKYQQRIKELDVQLALWSYRGLTLEIDEADTLLKQLNDTSIGHSSHLKKLDSAVEDIKVKRWQKNQQISEQKTRKFEAQRTIDRSENDLSHLRTEIDRLAAETAELEQARIDLQEKNRKIQAEIGQAETLKQQTSEEIELLRAGLSQERSAGDQVKGRVAELTEAVERHKAELMDRVAEEARYRNIHQNASKNRDDLQRRLKRIDEDALEAGRTLKATEDQQAGAQQRLAQIQNRLDELAGDITAAESVHAEKTDALAAQVKNVHVLELELNKIKSEYGTLKKMEENFEWYKDGVKAILKRVEGSTAGQTETAPNAQPSSGSSAGQTSGLHPGLMPEHIKGLVADLIEPRPSYETAVEAALGEALQFILVDNQHTARSAIDYLQSSGAGRCGFIPLDALQCLNAERSQSVDGSRRLLSKIQVKPGFESIADALLGHVVVAADIEEALTLFRQDRGCATFVTKDGDLISQHGFIIGGSREKISGILAKRQALKDLEANIQALEKRLTEAAGQQKEMEKEIRGLEIELQQYLERKNRLAQEKTDVDKDLYRLSEELKHTRRHLDIIRLEQEQLHGEQHDLDSEMSEYDTILERVVNEIKAAQQKVAVESENLNRVNAEVEDSNRKVVELKLQLTSLNARLDNVNNTLRRLHEFAVDGSQRLDQLDDDIQGKQHRRTAAIQRSSELQQRLTGLYEELKLLEKSLETEEEAYQRIDEQLNEHDRIIDEINSKRETILEKIRLLELKQAQRNVQRDNIVNRLEERYGLTLDDCRSQLAQMAREPVEEAPDFDTVAAEQELEQLRKRVAGIGDVNLGAISEYEQLKSRFDFLCEQRDDLEKAIEDLQTVIKKINKITQERFLETFSRLNQKLQEVFPKLFQGGSAKLVLTQPDNPLETGVEYMIHPPGKKLTRMSLLSGGEKALAAIAFVFSLFLLKPASFCLLDEIDAPLDEANVHRFNELLRMIGEKSQIVMVTHKKRSMEFADTLFGITMETKGISKIVSVNLDRVAA